MKNTFVANYVRYSLFGDKSAKNIVEKLFMFAPIEMDFYENIYHVKKIIL